MGTANFRTPENFPLYARDDDEFYMKWCPECGAWSDCNADTCEECGADLGHVSAEYDHAAAALVYEEVEQALEDLNSRLIFHRVSLRSGYYAGVQLWPEENDDAQAAGFYEGDTSDVDNDNAHYYFDMCRSLAIRKYQAEQRRLTKELAAIAKAWSFDQLSIVARFSNGETWYSVATA